jgi:outer membrane receptor protein involved in Fe transport
VRPDSSTLINAQIGWEIAAPVRLVADVFNVANVRVNDTDYYYVSRLAGEPSAGVADIHSHPAEPRTLRVGLHYLF